MYITQFGKNFSLPPAPPSLSGSVGWLKSRSSKEQLGCVGVMSQKHSMQTNETKLGMRFVPSVVLIVVSVFDAYHWS